MSDGKSIDQTNESSPGQIPQGKNLFALRRPKHRYLVITGPIEAAGLLCARMDDEGFHVISVSSTFLQQGNQMMQLATLTGLIARDTPKTPLELEVDAETKRLVQPVKGKFN